MSELDKHLRAVEAVQYPTSIIRELCNRDFYFFLKYFWQSICHDTFLSNWHIEYLCSTLQKKAERVANRLPNDFDLVINVPPGTSKTMTCNVMFPVWCWTKWYWMRFLTFGYNQELSLEAADNSRNLLVSQMFQEVYPELIMKRGKEGVTNFRIVKIEDDGTIRLGGGRFSSSISGTGTGFHGDLIIIDDPLNPKQAASTVELKNSIDWLDQTLPTRKTNKEVTPTILIMQRLHEGDPSGHLLAKKKTKVKHICLPGEINTSQYADKVRPIELVSKYVNGLLDPIRLPQSVLIGMEESLGQYGYAAQFGQSPTPPAGGMFRVDRFVMVESMPSPSTIIQTVRSWDKAGTKDGTGAFTVGTKIHKLASGKYLISDVVRGRWSAEVREQIIRSTAEADGPGVEIVHEQEPGSGGKDSAQATTRNLAGYSVTAERPIGNKIARADTLSVQVNMGNVMLLKGSWNYEFIEEFRYFPFSKFMDQVDSASMGFTKLAQKKQVLVLGRA